MRDLILIGFIGVCLVATLRYPFVGLLTWAWFTLMNPHQLTYDVYGIPLNMVIAGVTIASYIISTEISKFRFDAITILIISFAGWLSISQTFSLDPLNSAPYFDRFIKTLLFVLLCIQMTTNKLQFNALVWTLVAGIGFFAAKGALFTILTLGQFRVQGLPLTVLEDNNHFGIAAATILPLILYLRSQSAHAWLRIALMALFGATIIAIIGTHSRGAFLAMIFFGGFFWLRSNHKFAILAGLMILLVPTIMFMPAKWTERMTTITQATQDASFMGRVDAWVINYKLAEAHPFTGAGLRNSYQKEVAQSVDPERADSAKAAHSIYFEILGGSGFIGLIIFLSLYSTAFFSAWRVYLARGNKKLEPWKWNFAYYGQMSLVVFAVGGASTSMEMWEGYLVIIALIAAIIKMTPREGLQRPGAIRGYALSSGQKRNFRQRKLSDAPPGQPVI